VSGGADGGGAGGFGLVSPDVPLFARKFVWLDLTGLVVGTMLVGIDSYGLLMPI
jgi:hypothetical protein